MQRTNQWTTLGVGQEFQRTVNDSQPFGIMDKTILGGTRFSDFKSDLPAS